EPGADRVCPDRDVGNQVVAAIVGDRAAGRPDAEHLDVRYRRSGSRVADMAFDAAGFDRSEGSRHGQQRDQDDDSDGVRQHGPSLDGLPKRDVDRGSSYTGTLTVVARPLPPSTAFPSPPSQGGGTRVGCGQAISGTAAGP